MKRVKNKYKFYSGVQQIAMDTPDYREAYELQAKEAAKNQGIQNATGMLSGQFKGISDLGNAAGSVIKSRDKSKGGAQLGGAISMGSSGAALGAKIGSFGGPIGTGIGAGVGFLGGAIAGAARSGKEYDEGIKRQKEADEKANLTNHLKTYKIGGADTDAQARVAKKGKYKLKTKEQARRIEFEKDELILGPKKADGTRDKIFMSKNGPTHEEGGIPGVVVPKKMYTSGTKQLMSQRKPYKNPEITPPTPYELMPKPPKSRYKEGSKKVKVYR